MRAVQIMQIRIKLYTLKDISAAQVQEKLTRFIDTGFAVSRELIQMHEENRFKFYCFDLPFKIPQDKIYHQGCIYTVTVRTLNPKLAEYFYQVCTNHYTEDFKGLTAQICVLPKKRIECLYTLTPAILKDDQKGYWRTHMNLEGFEQRLKINLIKKWNYFTGEQIEEDFPLYTLLEFLNQKPIGVKYKNITLLGDKLRLQIADDEISQKIAYMALGTGLLENCSRGSGFVNYRWL